MKKFLKCVSVFALTFALMPNVRASYVDDAFESGKLTLKSIPLTNEEERNWYAGNILSETKEWKGTDSLYYSLQIDDEDIYKGVISKFTAPNSPASGTKNVTITYEYDEAVKTVADNLKKELGTDMLTVSLNDIEAITYRINADKYYDSTSDYSGEFMFPFDFANFSGDLNKKIKYKNFNLMVGAGGGTYFNNGNMGELSFLYNDTYYGNGPSTIVKFKMVAYVPEGTTDIPKAIKERVSKYFDVDTVELDTYDAEDVIKAVHEYYWTIFHTNTDSLMSLYPTAEDYLAAVYGNNEVKTEWGNYYDAHSSDADFQALLEKNLFDPSKESFVSAMVSEYTVAGELGEIPVDSAVYVITLKDGTEIRVLAEEDTEKAKDDRKVISSDAATGIEVSADGIIPLDTLIQVARITSGDDYDKIVKLLKNTNVDMFDLKLFTKTSNESITKLENGKFRVKLPIKEEFKGKNLKVYFVGTDDKVEEYKVTISDDGNYAIFETDHFSIYTLAAEGKNPKTGDSILAFVAMFVISTLFLIRIKKYN